MRQHIKPAGVRRMRARGRRRAGGARPRAATLRRLRFEALESRCVLSSSLLITEFMADNANGIRDGFDNRSDWIEIYNPTDSSVGLSGWFLTDDPTELDKWAFPAIDVAVKGHLLVFASGKSKDPPQPPVQDDLGYWHTNFKLDKNGEYLALVRRDGGTGELVVEHQYAPAYPPQLENVSYGLTYLDTGGTLVGQGDAAKVLIPSNDSLGTSWTTASFNDTGWTLGGPLGAGYEVLTTASLPGSNFYFGQYGPGGTWNLYEVVASPTKTWIQAYNDALARTQAGKAGHLVTIGSSAENGFVQGITSGLSSDCWIGLTDSDTYAFAALGAYESGNTSTWPLPQPGFPPASNERGAGFVWVTGEPFAYQKWASGQPDNSGTSGEDAVYISRSSGSWTDNKNGEGSQTGTNRPYVVEYDLNLSPRAFLTVRQAYTTSLGNIGAAVSLLSTGAGTTYAASVINYADPQNAGSGRFGNNAPFPGDTPADDNNFAVKATGTIRIPTGGSWTFDVNSDDGFRLKIEGATFTSVAGSTGTTISGETMEFPNGRGAADSLGVATIAAGDHYFELYHYEGTGGSGLEFSAAQGVKSAWDSSFKLVGDVYNGGLATVGLEDLIGTSLEAAMKGVNPSAYVRRTFSVEDPGLFDSLTLNLKYEDAFIAYLNGVEVARSSNVPASPGYNSAAASDRPVAFARSAESFNLTAYLGLLQPGVNVLAIHGMSQGADDSDFLVLPELIAGGTRPDPDQSTYFVTATPGAANISGALGMVADTRFSVERGFYETPQTVVITTSTPGAEIRYTLDGNTPTAAGMAKSVGSISRSGSTATANVSNHGYANGNWVQIRGADQPEYNGMFVISNVSGDRFDFTVSGAPASPATGTITVELTQPYCYTYTGPLTIDKTTTLRAAAFKAGYNSSNVDTQTYIFLDDVLEQSPDGTPPHVGEPVILEARFSGGAEGFSYADDAFGTSSAAATSGDWGSSYGHSDGGLRVYLEGPSTVATAGAWSMTFTTARTWTYGISFWFRLTQGPGFASTETSQVILTIDGVKYGPDTNTSIIAKAGDGDGQADTFGWYLAGVSAKLAPGTHTLTIGAYYDTASGADDWVELRLDDVEVTNWPANWHTWKASGQVLDYGMDPKIVDNPTFGPELKEALEAIPTISLVTDLPNLFDPTTGIYVNAGGTGTSWERPVSMELIYADGTEGFQIDAGLRIRGGFSVSTDNPKHAFRLFFRDKYGAGKLEYPLFGDEGTDQFDHIDLRCSQNYSWAFQNNRYNAEVREVFARDSGRAAGNLQANSRFYHLYIDGQYWGLYQTEERPEASFSAAYQGGEAEDYDVIKHSGGGIEATDGNFAAWWELVKMGFMVTTYAANVPVDSLATALAVLGDQSKWSAVTTNYYNTVNFTNNGGDGHYTSGNSGFPGITSGDGNNFVVEARATINLLTAGPWTFGVNSNDGFLLELSNGTDTFTASFPNTRTTAEDTLATFNITQPGPYTVRLVFFENTGAAGLELFAAPGSFATFDPLWFRLVGETASKGFKVTNYKAITSFPVDSLTAADTVIADPSKRSSTSTGYYTTVNFLDNTGSSGTGGHYGSNVVFPGDSTSDDNNFAVEAVGLLEIPAPGLWTFGVNSNDGFRLELTRGSNTYAFNYPNTRTTAEDTLGTFDLPEAGTYRVRLVYFENTGGAEVELFYAQGSYASFNSAAFQLARDNTGAIPYSGPGPFYWAIQGLNPDGTRNPDLPVLLDVDNLIDYMLVIFYTGDNDAPISNFMGNTGTNNWYGARNRNGDEGFRFYSHDAEHTLSRGGIDRTGPWPCGWSVFLRTTPQYIHQELMVDPEYRLRFADHVREYFFHGGLFTPEGASARFLARAEELGFSLSDAGPMVAESARWGDSKKTEKTVGSINYSGTTATVTLNGHGYANGDVVAIAGANQPEYNGSFVIFNVTSNNFSYTLPATPASPASGSMTAWMSYTKNTWLGAINTELTSFFPGRTATVLNQLRNAKRYTADHSATVAAPLYPATAAPEFSINGAPQYGGQILATDQLSFTAPAGSIYYTADGSDPRMIGGVPHGTLYNGTPLTLTQSTLLKARAINGSEWSALSQAWFYVGQPAAAGNLAITELNYHPAGPTDEELAVDPALTPDSFEFIELQNIGSVWIDLTGVQFTHGVTFDFTAAGATRLEPGGYLVIAADPAALAVRYPGVAAAGAYTGTLSDGGERIGLLDRFAAPIHDFQYRDSGGWPGRADGAGSTLEVVDTAGDYGDGDTWRSSYEFNGSPGRAGMAPVVDLVINEALTHTDPPLLDAIELYNTTGAPVDIGGWYLSDSSANYQKFRIPAGTVLGAGGYVVFDQADFDITPYAWSSEGTTGLAEAQDSGASLYLAGNTWRKIKLPYTLTAGSMLEFDFLSSVQGELQGIGFDSDDATDPGYGNIFRLYGSEAQGIDAFADYASAAPDWKHYAIPVGSFYTGAMTYLVFANDSDAPPQASASFFRNVMIHEGTPGEAVDFGAYFGLNGAHGDDVYLLKADGSGTLRYFADHVDFGAARNGEALGRWQDDQGDWHFVPLRMRTLGGPNSSGGNGPYVGSVVISEVMYNPGSGPGAEDLEFIEIYNGSGAAVELEHWRLRGGVDFDFAADTTLPANSVLVVVPFDPADPLNAAKLAQFRSTYGVGTEVTLVGGYQGRLEDAGEKVRLLRPDTPPDDEPDYYPGLLEDEVVYNDAAPWPLQADGGGSTLGRLHAKAWGDHAASWAAAAPSPGAAHLVAASHVFYNGSAFDGRSPAANPLDFAAIAPDKRPLFLGDQAGFDNYTSYSRGINGIFVDLAGLADPQQLTADDFAFRVGNNDYPLDDPGTWVNAAVSPSVTVFAGAGIGGTDRVTIIFPDNAIQNQWLEVTVKATIDTGLPAGDVFYFGNAVGESGNNQSLPNPDALVDGTDELAARNNKTIAAPASIANWYDFNRDRRVNAADELIARNNYSPPGQELRLIELSGGGHSGGLILGEMALPAPQPLPGQPAAMVLVVEPGTTPSQLAQWVETIGGTDRSQPDAFAAVSTEADVHQLVGWVVDSQLCQAPVDLPAGIGHLSADSSTLTTPNGPALAGTTALSPASPSATSAALARDAVLAEASHPARSFDGVTSRWLWLLDLEPLGIKRPLAKKGRFGEAAVDAALAAE